MTTRPTYFDGRHWETGSLHNALRSQGVNLSEAMLMGISGGAVFGYFTFDYEGHDPNLALLTRNTFDPMDTIFERLALPHDVIHTASPVKARQNLVAALESGRAPLVWADMHMLPYNVLGYAEDNWAMYPVVVYGLENETVLVADRSSQPLTVQADDFAAARARIKKDKHRIITLETPDYDRLPAAITKGIWDCIKLYTEGPPRGARKNFGLAAYQHWAAMLTNTRNKQSWERFFGRGVRLYAGLVGAYRWIMTWGAGDGMERGLYAEFLDEAAAVLSKPALSEVAAQFRASSAAWRELGDALLPDDAPLLAEARTLTLKDHRLFIDGGMTTVDERRAIRDRLEAIRQDVAAAFPLAPDQVVALHQSLAEKVLHIHDIEQAAIEDLQKVMS